MILTINDYQHNPRDCEITRDDFNLLYVQIVSGDEVLFVDYDDDLDIFDSSDDRCISIEDDFYLVLKEDVELWNEQKVLNSYERANFMHEFNKAKLMDKND